MITNGVNEDSSQVNEEVVSPGRNSRGQQAESVRHRESVCKPKEFKIGTWNVRTLHQAGKLDNLMKEMKRLQTDVMGVGEVRWPGAGEFKRDDGVLVYSGGQRAERGVGIAMNTRTSRSLRGYWAVSDRIIVVELESKPFNVKLIQIYAPKADSDEEELEGFYEDLDRVMTQCKQHEVNIVMGDLNAKVGRGREGAVLGPYGLGDRNERGDRFIEWCEQHNQIIANTWYRHHPRHLWTWRSPGDRTRNQIDYITINSRFKRAVTQIRTYPGADCDSDHNPVIATIKVKLKIPGKANVKQRRDLKILKDPQVKEMYRIEVRNKYEALQDDMDNGPERLWQNIQEAIAEGNSKHVPNVRNVKKKPWMTQTILDKMEERRMNKNNDIEYNRLNREVKKLCNKAKEEWTNTQCEELEDLGRRDQQRMYEKIKEMTGKRKSKRGTAIKAEDGTVLMDIESIKERWKQYVEDLFEDERPDLEEDDAIEPSIPIIRQEVENAIRQMKRGKAVGDDGVAVEMLEALGEFGVDVLTSLANKIYDREEIVDQMTKSTFITIPKVPGTSECSKFRTISIMNQICKIVLRVVLARIRGKIRGEVAEEQYGFVAGKGTRNAIFVLRNLVERAIEKKKDVFACFIDYEKAFDKIKHEELINILSISGIDKKDINIIKKLYWNQKAVIKVGTDETDSIKIKRGVRQGCVMSPDLFSIYSEIIMREIDKCEGISIGGRNITNIRYADDTVLLADSEERLQYLLNILVPASREKGLLINIKKTETMVFSKKAERPRINIRINGDVIKQVDSFNYLGSTLSADGRSEKEIKRRIAIAKTSFWNMKNILTNRKLSIPTRKRAIKCYVWSTLLYGGETWTISRSMEKRLEAMEMWLWRRMLKVSWTERKTNVEILRMAGEQRRLMSEIRGRQLQFVGHVMRRDELENTVLTGMVEGTRDRGRQREKYLDWMRKHLQAGMNIAQVLQRTRDREMWRVMVADVLQDMAHR